MKNIVIVKGPNTAPKGGVVAMPSAAAIEIATAEDLEEKPGAPTFEAFRNASRGCDLVRFDTEHETPDLLSLAAILRDPAGNGRQTIG